MNLVKILSFYLLTISVALAHGTDGDHSHDAAAVPVRSGAPLRIETFTEAFELVGQLQAGELSLLIDRYETNEPVLGATLEVELNGLKAPARFRADHGDYLVTDQRLLKALVAPGKHALIFTLAAANESDLLEGTMEVAATASKDTDSRFPWQWAGAGMLVALALVVLVPKLRRPKATTGK